MVHLAGANVLVLDMEQKNKLYKGPLTKKVPEYSEPFSNLISQVYLINNNSLNLGRGHLLSATTCSSLSTW
jgi:hypothetical protein